MSFHIEGSILHIEAGEYSDRGTIGFFQVLKSFDMNEAKRQFLSLHPQLDSNLDSYDCCHPDVSNQIDMFLAYLSQQFLQSLDYSTYHIGSYGRLS